jgi:ribosomal protein L29
MHPWMKRHSLIFKRNTLKKILILIVLQACFFLSLAQLPTGKMQAEEMKKMAADLKKELAALETEIQRAEKEDPEAVAGLKTQLSTMRTLLAAFDKPGPPSGKPKAAPASSPVKLRQTPSPLVRAVLKGPVVAPTVAQAKDHFFWYKGKKINDSTLITQKKTVIQYSRKRNLLIVQPEEKKDSFVSLAREISRGEQRKRELAVVFDKAPNGFIYYPYVVTTLAVYDDLTLRYSDAVKNTFSFDSTMPLFRSAQEAGGRKALGRGGPDAGADPLVEGNEVHEWVLQQLEEARKRFEQLPPVESFPEPPRRELGRCGSCDTSAIGRQRRLDAAWNEQYQGKEREIMQQARAAMRVQTLNGYAEMDREVDEKFDELSERMAKRIIQKDNILLDRYGDKLPYLPMVLQVLLGHERQRQLLGDEEGHSLGPLVAKMTLAYERYYKEQEAAKNYDFVLNMPFHLGIMRQRALLGGEEGLEDFGSFLDRFTAYNRFALTMELDFIWQSGSGEDLKIVATGKMATKEKVYVQFIPDSCGYRMLAHTADLENKQLEDIVIPMKVEGGVKTMPDEEGKLRNYPYSGAPQYDLRFPDCRLDFCTGVPDTLFLSVIGGNEEVAARGGADIQGTHRAYTIDMLIYAGQVLMNENTEEMEEGIHTSGNAILGKVAGFMQQAPPADTLDKLRVRYEGYMDMDDLRKGFEGSYSTRKAMILFNANNRTSILADTYIDTKRVLHDDVEVKKGLFHLRMAHEPKAK